MLSGSRSVTMATSASASMRWLVSTSLPFTFPASAARARPGPIAAAISATVTGPGNDFDEPSGRRMFGIGCEADTSRSVRLDAELADQSSEALMVAANQRRELRGRQDQRLEAAAAEQLLFDIRRFE